MLSRCLRTGVRQKLAPALSSHSSRRNYSHGEGQQRSDVKTLAVAASASLLAGVYVFERLRVAHADASATTANVKLPSELSPPERKDLPIFKRDEVKKHDRNASTIWVTFKGGVYDITNFVSSHPGGDKILMAAGGAIDPFWALYAQHKTKEVMEILEELRIGSLDPSEIVAVKESDSSDPFSTDPTRHPALIVNNEKPFNAETPPSLLIDSFRTPNELFFVRNHLPVPKTDPKSHRLTVEGLGVRNTLCLSVDELKKSYTPVSVTSVIQCAGNRRADMHRFKKVQGLMWEGTAISNAKWTGVRLRDLLILSGVDPNDTRIKHVQFEGADVDPTGKSYGASIPFEKAMSPETIVAYSMNDEDIPKDHGAPLRVIVPGNVGARQVKWLTTIRLSGEESQNHFQQKDYRAFSPAVQIGDELKWETVPSIQEYPIQCAFCTPSKGTKVDRGDGTIDVAGYAWSGGGRGIIRVEVSPDGGKNWQSAELEQDPDQDIEHMWAWTLFKASVKIPDGVEKLDLVVKATDRSYNTQPESAAGIWNVRGLLHNAWHRVEVKVVD